MPRVFFHPVPVSVFVFHTGGIYWKASLVGQSLSGTLRRPRVSAGHPLKQG